MTSELLAALLLAPFIGSFLGVVIERLPAGRPLLWGRSVCTECGRTLSWRELIPLLSWLTQQGRCACGRVRLGWFYPAIELAAVAVVLWTATVLSGWLFWASLGLAWTLLTLAVIDARDYVLPDALTLPLIPAGLAVIYLIDPGRLLDHVIGIVAGFAAFTVIAWLYRRLRGREGLGRGDARLLAAAGAWLGWQALAGMVLIAAIAALAVALAQTLAGSKLEATTRLPFGPYLALGFWLVWLYGPPIIG